MCVCVCVCVCITQTHTHTDTHTHTMARAILSKSWRQHPKKQQMYGHLPPITKTIQVRQHCWRSKDKLICYVLLWTPSHGRAKAERPAWTYIQQLCEDMESKPWGPAGCDERYGEVAREGQGYPYWWHDKLMIYIYIYIYIYDLALRIPANVEVFVG